MTPSRIQTCPRDDARYEALGRFLARIFAPAFEVALEVREERPDLDDDAAAEEVLRRLAARRQAEGDRGGVTADDPGRADRRPLQPAERGADAPGRGRPARDVRRGR